MTTKRKRPNIVFILAESMDGRKMGCMHHPAMQRATPNLDRLAADGALFTDAYTTFPVCNPARASMWTGKYPHHYDCWNNHEGIEKDVPTFRDTFEHAGYRTAALGPLDYAHGMHSIRDRVGSWTRSACIRRPLCRTPLPQVVADGSAHNGDRELTEKAVAWLNERAAEDEPFMLYLTTPLVHPAFVAEQKYMAMIDADQIDIPPGLQDVDGAGHPVDEYTRITKNCRYAFSERLVREIRHTYFAMIAQLDELVGRVLHTLDGLGLAETTYVVFSSDHGEMAGEHNQILKRTMYESSAHIPLIVRGPDVKAGAIVHTPVSLIDMYPTLLDMAGISYAEHAVQPGCPETLDGESLLPVSTGQSGARRGWAFSEYHADRSCTGTFMLRCAEWKYLKHIGYAPQLFDLSSDPEEMEDLASHRPDVVTELDGILTNHFDCEAIDARAKRYGKDNFRAWRKEQKAAGTYRDMMARIYSGYDRICIEDIVPWSDEDEAVIAAWLDA